MQIELVRTGHRYRPQDYSQVEYLVIHRSGVGSPKDAGKVFFEDEANGTGGKYPYHFYVPVVGAVQQAALLQDATPHAREYNRCSIAIAIEGDPRWQKLPKDQYARLVELLVWLSMFFGWSPRTAKIVGHTSLPKASGDPKKVCPGKYLPMRRLRYAVEDRARQIANGQLAYER